MALGGHRNQVPCRNHAGLSSVGDDLLWLENTRTDHVRGRKGVDLKHTDVETINPAHRTVLNDKSSVSELLLRLFSSSQLAMASYNE